MPRALSPQPRADVQMRLGIFGGTFNPVHLGHLLLAETAREMLALEREGTSYTIDTVKALHRQLPGAKLFLLIGEDMLGVRWLAWNEVKRLCTVVVAHRRGSRVPRRETGMKWLAMPQVEIASSDIRARLKAGRSIRYLVPASVERYLEQHQLYQRGRKP